MGNIHLLIANANQNFTGMELEILHSAADKATVFISDNFDFDYEVDIIIATPSSRLSTIPEDGISGQTYHSRLILIAIDKQQKAINEDIVFETICHEMSHSLRWEKLPEHSNTMFDGIIMEGLAVILEEKAMGDTDRKSQQFFLTEIQNTSQNRINYMLAQLRDGFGNNNYSYDTVFFTGNERLPRWAGYRLGYYFIKKHLEKTGRTISQANLASYSEFVSEI